MIHNVTHSPQPNVSVPAGNSELPVPHELIPVKQERLCNPQDWLWHAMILSLAIGPPKLASILSKVQPPLLPLRSPIETLHVVYSLTRKWSFIILRAFRYVKNTGFVIFI